MFGKLMKHEFRATGRTMLPVLAALVVLAILANISFVFIDYVTVALLDVLMGLFIVAYFLGIFAAGVICLVIMISRFYNNVLGSEGYITMTLPTDVHGIIWSKLLVSLVWTLVTALVIFATVFATMMTVANIAVGDMIGSIPAIGEIIDRICEELDTTRIQLVGAGIEAFIIILVASIFTFLHFYSAMSLGHIFAKHKVLLSVVFFLLLNVFFSIFGAACTFVAGSGISEVFYNGPTMELLYVAMHYMLALMTAESVIVYFITVISLKRGLNLA